MFPDMFSGNEADINVEDIDISNKCSREHSNDLSTPCLYRRRQSVMAQTNEFMKENENNVSLGGLLILCICFMYAAILFLVWALFGKVFSMVNIGVPKSKPAKPFRMFHPSNLNHPISRG